MENKLGVCAHKVSWFMGRPPRSRFMIYRRLSNRNDLERNFQRA